MNDFQSAYDDWMQEHISLSSGEHLRRLEKGHEESELLFLKNVWWPVVGSFEYLHPEYEVIDFKGGTRYIDFAYIRRYYKVAWEILGFGPHWRNISRWKFGDDWIRHCDLMNDGWEVMYLAYDYINEKEQVCRRVVQQMMGRLFGMGDDLIDSLQLSMCEERIVRRMKQCELDSVSPAQASSWLGVERKAARKVLLRLADKGLLSTDNNIVRTRTYSLNKELAKFRRL